MGYGDYDSDGPIPDPPLVVVIPEVSEEPTPGIIETEFIKNLYDLIEYYINSLKDIVSKYYKTLISELPNNINIKDFSFLYNDINVSNKDIVSSYQHVLDLGLRNEKLSNLKTNFLTNSFNFNQTLYHLKNFLFTYELRKKYGNISYVKNTDISNSLSNNILKACKIDYGLKYDKAYENLYRYLNSSLKVTNNIIDDVTKGILAKGILTEKGGI